LSLVHYFVKLEENTVKFTDKRINMNQNDAIDVTTIFLSMNKLKNIVKRNSTIFIIIYEMAVLSLTLGLPLFLFAAPGFTIS